MRFVRLSTDYLKVSVNDVRINFLPLYVCVIRFGLEGCLFSSSSS
jgi:hypothetical protein